ncbi:MAG: FIST N-terminal domain-containing protein [Mangrovicoccus sp.]
MTEDAAIADLTGGLSAILPSANCDWNRADGIAYLAKRLALKPGDLVALFISPLADAYRIARQAERAFPGITVIGCTTAGEISAEGYASGQIVAVGLPSQHFSCATVVVPDLAEFDQHQLAYEILSARSDLSRQRPGWDTEFAFTLIDGLSLREDEWAAALAMTLGPMPVFGGSAGDDIEFHQAFVLHQGAVLRNAAVLTLVRSACEVRVFKFDHLLPTHLQMVVTGANPAARIVHEINAEPAGRELARILGKDPYQLSQMTFAAHPVLVRIGNQHHVRAIQRVTEDGNLVFFSAIGEGVVLTLAEAAPIADHLEQELATLTRARKPAAILGFDCVLRRVEAEQLQLNVRMSEILRKHGVVGFNTYGEQISGMHVNQTFTGVAIYPPESHSHDQCDHTPHADQSQR